MVGGNSTLAGTPDGLAGPAAFTFDVVKGTLDGLEGTLDDMTYGVISTMAHPIQTLSSAVSAAIHPIDTYNIMKDAINTSYERDVINGDAESRAEWFSYAGGTIITSVAGTKGAGTETKAGTFTAKNGITTAKTKLGNMGFRNPFGREPELAQAGGNIPYNVYDGKAVKNQRLQFAENFKGGKSGVNAESGLFFSRNPGVIKDVYNSIKQSPKYPSGFKGIQNGTKKVNIKNQNVLEKLREVESGQWKKVYKDGYDSNGKKISIHYFQGQSGKIFDVKVKSGWSNN